MPTSAKILLNKFHLQMEYLLLKLTDGVLRSLPPCHHIAQVPHLKRHRRDFSPHLLLATSKGLLTGWKKAVF